jgi:hypothetical protein
MVNVTMLVAILVVGLPAEAQNGIRLRECLRDLDRRGP